MTDSETWTTIESDPGVFTELMSDMGVRGVQVEEVYSLDEITLSGLSPVYGLVFLFKWQQQEDDRATLPESEYQGKVFFAKQVITNACATQALLSIVLNRPDIQLGKTLEELQAFTADFPADLKGHAISNSEVIRKSHNSFRAPNPLIPEESAEISSDEVFHFIAYVPVQGQLYELDGLKPGPISLCQCTNEDWVKKVQPFIQQRMDKYSASEIRFNLLALIRDRRDGFSEHISQLEQDPAASSSLDIQQQLQELRGYLASEEEKHAKWYHDNVRRRTNYLPFLFRTLKILAEEQKLGPLLEKAKQIQQ